MKKKLEKANSEHDKLVLYLENLKAKLPFGFLTKINKRLSQTDGKTPSISTIRNILNGTSNDKYGVIDEAIALANEFESQQDEEAKNIRQRLITSGLYDEQDFQSQTH